MKVKSSDMVQAGALATPAAVHLHVAFQVDSKYATEPGWVTGSSERFKSKNNSAVRVYMDVRQLELLSLDKGEHG